MFAPMLAWDALQPEPRRPLRRGEYERLIASGAFADERVELLDGAIVSMSPQGDAHIRVSAELVRRLYVELIRLGALEQFTIQSHSPYAASDASEPEPDVAVVPRGMGLATTCHLIVEVSDSSLRKDRRIKTRIYADAGVPEYWIVDVPGGAVEVYTTPIDGSYAVQTRLSRGEVLRPRELPGVAIAVADIFEGT
jgi:Uma2 family endonuclease